MDIFDYCLGLSYSMTTPLLLFKTTWALRYSPKLVPTLVYSLIAIVLTSSSPPEQLGEMLFKTVSVLAYDIFEIINDSYLRVYYTTPT